MRRFIQMGLALAAIALALGAWPHPAAAGTPPADRRVVVISLPGVRWKDIQAHDLPNLQALLDESAVANLATRVTRVVAEPGEAYLTMGAGTRAVAPDELAGRTFQAGELFGAGTAAEEHARQQGVTSAADVLSLSWALLDDENGSAEFGGTIGLLGQALEDAGVARGVVANADGADPFVDDDPIHREAPLALADEVGAVPCGQVDEGLLMSDPAAPYGTRLSQEAVVEAFKRCSEPGSVVLVEASDLRRARDFQSHATDELATQAFDDALASTDALVGELLQDLDPERDAVVVLAPTTDPATGLGVLGIRAAEHEPGFLTSANTRRDGYVLLTDLTPTLATLAGVDLDEGSIEGRAVEAHSTSLDADERIQHLVDSEAAALFRDEMLDPAVYLLITAVGLLALATGVGCLWGWAHLRPFLEGLALGILAYPPVTYLAGLLPFHEWGKAAFFAFVIGGSVLLAVVAMAMRRDLLRPLVALYGLTVAVVVLSVVVLGSQLQLATVFGDSPIVAGRFTGINNVTFAYFFMSGVILACLAVQQWPGTRGRQVMVGTLALILIVDVMPLWGADVGGALAGVPALLLIGMGLGRWKVRWRTVLIAVIATAVVIGVLAWIDLSRDAADRSHLGRLFERIGSDGSSGLTTVVERKLVVNLRSISQSTWRYLFGPLLIGIALVAWRGRDRVAAVVDALPPLRWALPGIVLLLVLGYAANDSGIAVPAAMCAVAVPGFVYLACRVEDRVPS